MAAGIIVKIGSNRTSFLTNLCIVIMSQYVSTTVSRKNIMYFPRMCKDEPKKLGCDLFMSFCDGTFHGREVLLAEYCKILTFVHFVKTKRKLNPYLWVITIPSLLWACVFKLWSIGRWVSPLPNCDNKLKYLPKIYHVFHSSSTN